MKLFGIEGKFGSSKWNPDLFTQGVVVFAFEDLMPLDERMAVTRRAVNWASSTVEIKEISK